MRRQPVYTWAMRSSQPRGGQIITYETRLNDDGSLSCNCPGWIFSRNAPKTCKHTNHVSAEFNPKDILRRFKAGERFELLDEENNQITSQPSVGVQEAVPVPKPDTGLKYGRLVEFD